MSERAQRKEQVGMVVSDRMEKTRVIRVETRRRHPLYKKTLRQVRRFKAHDERNESRTGDRVLIAETRPLSRDKRWRIVRVLERAKLESGLRDVSAVSALPPDSASPRSGAPEELE